jgi:branched-chain amino acid transport system permease protein
MSAFQLLNGATFGALLFVVASGFTLIFGLLRIVNLSHGALYLAGGYIGFSTAVHTGSFALAGSAAILAVAFLGFALDQGFFALCAAMSCVKYYLRWAWPSSSTTRPW